ncbi:Enhancer of mRNA-decapping protein 3 [Eumeta japonica]|uniref:Enhancer of mRNA-decapping protein 3 n=1 Tax=Eumeta variegata TaxID=151549 RepID=A0A4C1XZI4_EUMVA|nr:Enhancer of mRNA-decapping protein 3 [Eumeta japonica]
MAQWVGWAVSVNCGEPLGCYQGTILDADGATVTLTKAFRNGFPYPKSKVTLNAADIKELKIIEPRAESNEQTHSTVAVSKNKKGHRATVCESLQNNPSGAEGASSGASTSRGATRGRSSEGPIRTPKAGPSTGGGGGASNATSRGRERARRRDEACFAVDEGVLEADFDFEKNLALFDKRALWEELRHSHKPDVVRQTECGAAGGKLRHDENVLAGAPASLAMHAIRLADDARGPIDYVTDEGVVVPSVSGGTRRALWAALTRRGLADGALLLMARAAADLALRLVGGGRRLDPRNTHQLPCVVVLPGPHREGACGVMVARLLASHGVRTAVLAPSGPAAESTELRRALAAYALTGQSCVRRVAELPSPDLVVIALASPDCPEEPCEEAVSWARGARAALLAVEPPAAGTAGLSARACVVGGLPLAHAASNGLVYLADVAAPATLLLTLLCPPRVGPASSARCRGSKHACAGNRGAWGYKCGGASNKTRARWAVKAPWASGLAMTDGRSFIYLSNLRDQITIVIFSISICYGISRDKRTCEPLECRWSPVPMDTCDPGGVTSCGWESLMKSVTLGNVTMSHRTREAAECLALSHPTMIGLPRAQH